MPPARLTTLAARHTRLAPVASDHPLEYNPPLARFHNAHLAIAGVERNHVASTRVRVEARGRARTRRALGAARHRVIDFSVRDPHSFELTSRLDHGVYPLG